MERYNAPTTYEVRDYAEEFLTKQRRAIERGDWKPPREVRDLPLVFAAYAAQWVEHRRIQESTRDHYKQLLRNRILPAFGQRSLKSIRKADVRAWYATQDARADGRAGKPTTTAQGHAYGLLKAILQTALEDELIDSNPCVVKGGSQTTSAKTYIVASPKQIAQMAQYLTAHGKDNWAALVLIAAWCSLRFGEVTELRRSDIDLDALEVSVTRAVTRSKAAGPYVKDPKGAPNASKRVVSIPPHIVPALQRHLDEYVGGGPHALLFPGPEAPRLINHTFQPWMARCATYAGASGMTFHDLRHTGATYYAAVGATVKESQERLGHATPRMALHYQHAVPGRDQDLAARMSAMADEV